MSLYVVNNHGEIPIADETYHCLSRAYARMGKADSARLYLTGLAMKPSVPKPQDYANAGRGLESRGRL